MLSPKKFGNFHVLLNESNNSLDVIAIIESIKENLPCPINIQFPNYSIEHTPTEALAIDALLYYNNRLSFKSRREINMYAPGKLESVFIEIACPKTSNSIIGCICKHSMFHIEKFNSIYISPLKLLNRSPKQTFLLADFKWYFRLGGISALR